MKQREIVTSAVFLGFLFVHSGAPSFARAADRPPGGFAATAREIHVRTLKNGMKILVWPDHDIPNVAIYNWYRVGSRRAAIRGHPQ